VAALHHHPLRAGDTAFTRVDGGSRGQRAGIRRKFAENRRLAVAVLDAAYLQQVETGRTGRSLADARATQARPSSKALMQRAKSAAKPCRQAVDPRPRRSRRPKQQVYARGLAAGTTRGSEGAWKWVGIGLGCHRRVGPAGPVGVMRLENGEEKPEFRQPRKSASTCQTGWPPLARPPRHSKTPSPRRQTMSRPRHRPTSRRRGQTMSPLRWPPNLQRFLQVPSAPRRLPRRKQVWTMLKLQAIFYSSQDPSASDQRQTC
jgi:hypothetical protein